MSVTSIVTDLDALTLTLVADFAADTERVWQLWADPRQLERWWGPPSYPATVAEHDLSPGGTVSYYMTGPQGERYPGWWRVTAADPPKALEFLDGFARPDGTPDPQMPVTTVRMQLLDHDGGTRMELHSSFDTRQQMDQLLSMGMDEGLQLAVGQIDALLAG